MIPRAAADNMEPLLLGSGSSTSNMMDTSTFAVTNVVGALESLLYGAIVPGARIVMLAAPQFSAALQEQFDAKYLLLGLPSTTQCTHSCINASPTFD